jgi:hypothetical protein
MEGRKHRERLKTNKREKSVAWWWKRKAMGFKAGNEKKW